MRDRRGAGRGTVTKAEYESMAAVRYALRRFLRFSEDGAKAVGLTPQQHQALLAIKGYPARDSVTVGELAERLQVRHHSAVGLVDRLEALGLVEPSPAICLSASPVRDSRRTRSPSSALVLAVNSSQDGPFAQRSAAAAAE